MSRNIRLGVTLADLARQRARAELQAAVRQCREQIDRGSTLLAPGTATAVLSRAGTLLDSDVASHPLTAEQALPALESLLEQADQESRYSLAEAVTEVLERDLGAVLVRRVDGAAVTGVEAWFDDGGVFALAVQPDSLTSDQADASGRCASRQAGLERGLSTRGIGVEEIARDDHRQAVGPLLAAAAAASPVGGSIAEAIAAAPATHIEPDAPRPRRQMNRTEVDQ